MRRFPLGSPVPVAPPPSRRQHVLRNGAGIILLLTLNACAQAQPLTPHVVLQRAAAASKTLQSARFTAVGTMQTDSGNDWSFSLANGILQDGGSRLQFSLHAQEEGGASGSVLSLDVVSLSQCNVYFRSRGAVQFGSGTQWWHAKCENGEGVRDAVDDPAITQMQYDAIIVNRDRGIDQLNGRDVFHYDVSMDTGRLVSLLQEVPGSQQNLSNGLPIAQEKLNGELWIDAETFYVHRLSWGTTPDGEGQDRDLRLHFSLHLWDHGAAPSVDAPEPIREFPVPIPSQGYGFLSLFLLLPGTGLAS